MRRIVAGLALLGVVGLAVASLVETFTGPPPPQVHSLSPPRIEQQQPEEPKAERADGQVARWVLLSPFGLLIYFGPAIIAKLRNHHQRAGIFALNLLLGWTALGWIVALVWACTYTPADPPAGNQPAY